jgi:hypothetical protein
MVMTQWLDILGVIGAIFAGVSALLVLVVYLERSTPAAADEQALNEPDRDWIEHWAPDVSVQAGASYLPRAGAAGLGLDPPGAGVAGHLFTVLPPNTGQQSPLTWR